MATLVTNSAGSFVCPTVGSQNYSLNLLAPEDSFFKRAWLGSYQIKFMKNSSLTHTHHYKEPKMRRVILT